MKKPREMRIPDIEAKDPEAAAQKFEDFTRRILAVPKKEVDAKLAKEKQRKHTKQ